jgi:GWxTD domain-containing protein
MPRMTKIFSCAVAVLLLMASGGAAEAQRPADWTASAEALFLTEGELREWASLKSGAERDAFKERYWLRRDPTPREAGNEFRDAVLGRIRRANERFPLRDTPGSETARGHAFVLLGTPARVQEAGGGRPGAPPPPGTPQRGGNIGIVEGIETTVVWMYDRERTPALLEALGRPKLELTFIIEPQRGTDRLQTPGLLEELRRTLAARSVVTEAAPAVPEAPAAPASPGAPASPASPALPALDEGSREKLTAVPAHAAGVVSGHTVLWSDTPAPELHAWVFVPRGRATGNMRFHAIAKDASGKEVAAWSAPAVPVPSFFTTSGEGAVFAVRGALPAGQHDLQFGFTSGAEWHASSAARVDVPDLSTKAFAVSPVVVSAGPSPEAAGPSLALLPARADATFALTESLWTVVELANVANPAGVTLDLTLARGGSVIGGTGEQPANPVETANGRHLAAFELPLASLAPGEYTLSLTVRPKAGSDEGRVVRQIPVTLVQK